MREVKFREWDTERKTMSYGKREDFDDMVGFRFDHEEGGERILMQYTGLKDVNGTEIYEGDITTNELYKSEGLAFVVYYDNEKGMFKQSPFMFENNGKKLGNTDLTLQMDSVTNKEVIGNIYENPELLEDVK